MRASVRRCRAGLAYAPVQARLDRGAGSVRPVFLDVSGCLRCGEQSALHFIPLKNATADELAERKHCLVQLLVSAAAGADDTFAFAIECSAGVGFL